MYKEKLQEYMVDVIIPVYKPEEELLEILKSLSLQSKAINRIILINTEKEFFDEEKYLIKENIEVHHISKNEFDHASTRNMGLQMSKSDFVLFMTMDAVPKDEYLVEHLLNSFGENGPKGEPIAVAYARQLPKEHCGVLEQYARIHNYPLQSKIKTYSDIKNMGLHTYFCSDSCCMYNREVYLEIGGFVEKAIFNEDMIYAAQSIKNGYAVYYCAKAKVYHSHNYKLKEQFKRSFDMGVSQAEHPEVFVDIKTESAGIELVKNNIKYLIKKNKWYLIPYLFVSSATKLMGYKFGKNFKKLTKHMILKMTMNKAYWVEL